MTTETPAADPLDVEALAAWLDNYDEIEEGGEFGPFMTQLNHGNDEYQQRIRVVGMLRAYVAARAAK